MAKITSKDLDVAKLEKLFNLGKPSTMVTNPIIMPEDFNPVVNTINNLILTTEDVAEILSKNSEDYKE